MNVPVSVRVTTLAVVLGALAIVFAALPGLALEAQEVAVLRTADARGGVRETRVWVARAGGDLLLEAATPERAWYRDILRNPSVQLTLGGRTRAFRAQPVAEPEGHAQIRSLLREKYGLADWWVGLLQDTSQSVAVRLVSSQP